MEKKRWKKCIHISPSSFFYASRLMSRRCQKGNLFCVNADVSYASVHNGWSHQISLYVGVEMTEGVPPPHIEEIDADPEKYVWS